MILHLTFAKRRKCKCKHLPALTLPVLVGLSEWESLDLWVEKAGKTYFLLFALCTFNSGYHSKRKYDQNKLTWVEIMWWSAETGYIFLGKISNLVKKFLQNVLHLLIVFL